MMTHIYIQRGEQIGCANLALEIIVNNFHEMENGETVDSLFKDHIMQKMQGDRNWRREVILNCENLCVY